MVLGLNDALVELTPGEYQMDIYDSWGRPLEVEVQCSWGERGQIRDAATAVFQ